MVGIEFELYILDQFFFIVNIFYSFIMKYIFFDNFIVPLYNVQKYFFLYLFDLIYIEKNICSSLFNTITNAQGTKSNYIEQQLEIKEMKTMHRM